MRRDKDPPIYKQVDPQMVVNTGFPGLSGVGFGIYDKNYFASLPAVGREPVNNNVHELPAGTWNLLEAAYDGTTEYGYVNGILEGTKTNLLKTGSNVVQIGLQHADFTHTFRGEKSDGDFAELLIYNVDLSDAQRQQVQDYLASKWFGGKLPINGLVSTPEVWLDLKLAKGSSINEFSYCKETGQFLIGVENRGTSLWLFDPEAGGPVQLLPATRYAYRQNLRWVGASQYAFVSKTGSNSTITVADVSGAKKTSLFGSVNASRFTATPDGKYILVTGIAANEPADGIWQSGLDSTLSHCVVPYADNPSPLIKRSDPVHGIATVNGHKLDYYIYRPDGAASRWKKHPLVIGNTVFVDSQYQQNPDGPLWAQALANCGAYVVIVDRRGWAGKEIGQWSLNIMDIYDYLTKDPTVNVDWNRVFLFASGSEKQQLGQLIIQRPELWKGAMFLAPSALPDFLKMPRGKPAPKILISLAGFESGEGQGLEEQITQYQETALTYGVVVDYIEDKEAPQLLQSRPDVLERTKAIVHFVFDD